MDTESILKEKVTQFSPELQRLKKIDSLLVDDSDTLYEIPQEQQTAISLFRALDQNIVKIPATMCFIANMTSLSRSLERRGRLEFVTVLKRAPIYAGMPETDEQQDNKPGMLSRFFGMFSRKPKPGQQQQ